jgi:hypothetical protein
MDKRIVGHDSAGSKKIPHGNIDYILYNIPPALRSALRRTARADGMLAP